MKSPRHRSPRAATRKALRIVGQGVPVYLPNDEAAQIIAEHDGEYCPKSVFKAYRKQQEALTEQTNTA